MFCALSAMAVDALWNPSIKSVLDFGNQRRSKALGPGTTKDYYLAKGAEAYVAVDMNEKRDAVIGDLNLPLQEQGFTAGSYDLVVNNGTSEHVFDQAAVFRNVHDMCRVGGVMMHVVPFCRWINHGLYSYNPIFFAHLAGANKYPIRFLWIADRGGTGTRDVKLWMFKEKRPWEMEQLVSRFEHDPMLAVAMIKKHDAAFRIPIQGKYLADIANPEMRQRYDPAAECAA